MKKSIFKLISLSILSFSLFGCSANSVPGPKETPEPTTENEINGEDGTRLLTGEGKPLPNEGKIGDSYIDIQTWDYYIKTSDGWILSGNIKSSSESGKSAYELYKETHPDYTGDEEQWLDDLINDRLTDKEIHTVTFNSNGGTEVEPQIVIHGEKAVRPNNPTKVGCSFSDWVDENNDHWVFNGYSITSNIVLSAVWTIEDYDYSKIIINEICPKSRKCFHDTYGEESDWIELYNSSSVDINLKGCGLSSSSDDLYKLVFDDFVIGPEEYAVIAASGRDEPLHDGEYHTPFTLSNKNGGTVYFSSPNELKTSVDFPALKDDISYGLIESEYEMLFPSPNEANETVYIEKMTLEPPSFSELSGFYSSEFDLKITSEEGYKVVYTIDSSTPTLDSNEYTSPIRIYDKSSEENIISSRKDVSGTHNPYVPSQPVNKCMVVRARCYDENGNYSPVVSRSFWVDQDDFLMENVPVMSISTDVDNLFGYEKGIYCNGKIFDDWKNSEDFDPSMSTSLQPANFRQEGFDWEREANITYLNEKHKSKCEQLAGIRIRGGATRANPKKSFSLYSRYLYDGNSKFDYKFNGKKSETIALRAGGNRSFFMATDTFNSMIAKKYELNFETQDFTETYLFLNGEFWGVYYIIDKYDSNFIEKKYGVENVMMCKSAKEIEEGYQTDMSYFSEAYRTIKSSLLTDEGYEAFENAYCLDSFIDMFVFQSYINNADYDLFSTNTEYWRSRYYDENISQSDTRIRFMLFDTDISLGVKTTYDQYPIIFKTTEQSANRKYLFMCEQFVNAFTTRAKEIVNMLSSDDCISTIEEYYESFEPLLRQNNLRFYGKEEAGQTDLYNTHIEFLKNRSTYYLSFIDSINQKL